MNLRVAVFLGAMLIVLVEAPFLPTVAHDDASGAEPLESEEGAGDGALGTNGALCTCIDEGVLVVAL